MFSSLCFYRLFYSIWFIKDWVWCHCWYSCGIIVPTWKMPTMPTLWLSHDRHWSRKEVLSICSHMLYCLLRYFTHRKPRMHRLLTFLQMFVLIWVNVSDSMFEPSTLRWSSIIQKSEYSDPAEHIPEVCHWETLKTPLFDTCVRAKPTASSTLTRGMLLKFDCVLQQGSNQSNTVGVYLNLSNRLDCMFQTFHLRWCTAIWIFWSFWTYTRGVSLGNSLKPTFWYLCT